MSSQISEDSGPAVTVWQGTDCHLDPEVATLVNLGIEHFSGWDNLDFPTTSRALTEVARIEAGEPFYGQGCYETTYINGLKHYAEALKLQGNNSPLEPMILESLLRHGVGPEADPILRAEVAELFGNHHSPLQEFIVNYLISGRSASGNGFSAGFKISPELATAIAQSLADFPPSLQTRLISLIDRSHCQKNTALCGTLLEQALLATQAEVVDQAVHCLKDCGHPQLEELMAKCWSSPDGSGEAKGVAITYLMERHPEDPQLRGALREKIKQSGYGAHGLLSVVMEGHNPGAVEIGLSQVEPNWRVIDLLANPPSAIKLAYNNFLAADQRERDLNRISWHLSHSFSSLHEHEVTEAIRTLIRSNHEPSLKFLQKQLHSPPNENRAGTIERIWTAERSLKMTHH